MMLTTIDWSLTYDELQTLRGAIRVARQAGRGTVERLKQLERMEGDVTALMLDCKDKEDRLKSINMEAFE